MSLPVPELPPVFSCTMPAVVRAARPVSNRVRRQQEQALGRMSSSSPALASTRLQLFLSATGLKNVACSFGAVNPFAVVTVRSANAENHPTVVGQTDIVFHNLNPTWSRPIYVEGYKLGSPLYFEVGIFDFDSRVVGESEAKLARMDVTNASLLAFGTRAAREQIRTGKFPHRRIGTALFEVGQVLGAPGSVAGKYLGTNRGAVYAYMERSSVEESCKFRFCLSGVQLQNVQTVPLVSSPFYEIFRQVERPSGAQAWMSVYRSNTKRFNLSPLWNERTLEVASICNGDVSRPLKIIVWDYRRSGNHMFMGEFETTLTGLMDSARQYNLLQHQPSSLVASEALPTGHVLGGFPLIRNGVVAGTIQVLDATIYHESMRETLSLNPFTAENRTTTTNSLKQGASTPACFDTPASASQPWPLAEQQGHQRPPTIVSPQLRPMSEQPVFTTQDMFLVDSQDAAQIAAENPRPNFKDYILEGCELSFAVAIDFTASNGNPREKGTPHYFHAGNSRERNDYEKAIDAVEPLLAEYDTDQKFPVWGFGIKLGNEMRNCFLCGRKEEVDGVAGIKAAYRNVFRSPLDMSYPTVFKEVIKTAKAYAQYKQDIIGEQKLAYTILLILTVGDVDTDNLRETKRCLMDASAFPLSVVFVNVGGADLSDMKFVDDDNHGNVQSCRDNTTFVRLRDYSPENLAETILDKVSDQLVTYFFDERNIPPGYSEQYLAEDIDTNSTESMSVASD